MIRPLVREQGDISVRRGAECVLLLMQHAPRASGRVYESPLSDFNLSLDTSFVIYYNEKDVKRYRTFWDDLL